MRAAQSMSQRIGSTHSDPTTTKYSACTAQWAWTTLSAKVTTTAT